MSSSWPKLFIGAGFFLGGIFSGSVADLTIYFSGHSTLYNLIFLIGPLVIFFILTRLAANNKPFFTSALILISGLFAGMLPFLYFIHPWTEYFTAFAVVGILIFSSITSFGFSIPDVIDPFRKPGIQTIKTFILWYLIPFSLGFLISPFIEILYPAIVPAWTGLMFLGWFLSGKKRIRYIIMAYILSFSMGIFLALLLPVPEKFDAQEDYEDKVVYYAKTTRNELTVTQWKKYYWIYLNDLKHISSFDMALFYEPMIHPAASLVQNFRKGLILGGENGLALYEILKYDSVSEIDLIPFDPDLAGLFREDGFLSKINGSSFKNQKVTIQNTSISSFLIQTDKKYDLIVVDLPDPRNLEVNQFYSVEFYRFLKALVNDSGIMVTQAGSPYFAPEAFQVINRTIREAGWGTLPLHNQVPTIGEWGWIIGSPNREQKQILFFNDQIKTRWLNEEALNMLNAFGKNLPEIHSAGINSMENPVLYKTYLQTDQMVESLNKD